MGVPVNNKRDTDRNCFSSFTYEEEGKIKRVRKGKFMVVIQYIGGGLASGSGGSSLYNRLQCRRESVFCVCFHTNRQLRFLIRCPSSKIIYCQVYFSNEGRSIINISKDVITTGNSGFFSSCRSLYSSPISSRSFLLP